MNAGEQYPLVYTAGLGGYLRDGVPRPMGVLSEAEE
jgi:hypothetical protein